MWAWVSSFPGMPREVRLSLQFMEKGKSMRSSRRRRRIGSHTIVVHQYAEDEVPVVVGLLSAEVAAYRLVRGKIMSVKDSPRMYRSADLTITIPEIAVAMGNVPSLEHPVSISKTRIRERDRYTCVYCGNFGDTIDHIHPRCLGGPDTWWNLVTACSGCNEKKGHTLLSELGWKMRYIPRQPVRFEREQALVNEYFTESEFTLDPVVSHRSTEVRELISA